MQSTPTTRPSVPSVRTDSSDSQPVLSFHSHTVLINQMDLLQPHASKVRVPTESDRVFKDECLFSFDSPVRIIFI